MTLALWIAVTIGMLMAFGSTGWASGRPAAHTALAKRSVKLRLPLPPHLAEKIIDRAGHRTRWLMAGAAIGLVIGIVAVLLVFTQGESYLIYFAAMAGAGIGALAAMMAGTRRGDSEAPRCARSRATVVGDYVGQGELIVARLSPVLALIPVVTATVLLAPFAPSSTWYVLIWGGWLTAVGMWIGTELVARRILELPQRAHSSLELAWDDVERSDALRHVFGVPVLLALGSMVSSMVSLGTNVIDPEVREGAMEATLAAGMTMLLVAGALLTAVATAAIVVWFAGGAHHALRRLWSEGLPAVDEQPA